MQRLPRSVRKYVRNEKARIRRAFSTKEEQEIAILALLRQVGHPAALHSGEDSVTKEDTSA